MYNNNKENFNDLIEASKNFDIPIVLVRPHGLEEVPESLEKEASTIVGWNANCIVDAIKMLRNRQNLNPNINHLKKIKVSN